MQSLFNFIIQPKNGRYTNTVKIGKKELIINTSIEDHKFVNRVGIVKSIPLHIGVLKYGNDSLKAVNVKEKDIVCFTPNSEYEFIIDNNRLYRMKTRDIAIKYEYKKNESEYNTSWASGG